MRIHVAFLASLFLVNTRCCRAGEKEALTWKFHDSGQACSDFIRHHSRHSRIKQTGCNSDDSNSVAGEITSHGESKRGYSAFGGTVCNLRNVSEELRIMMEKRGYLGQVDRQMQHSTLP